tara:strand:+ start:490 stop:1074 length:585 start_codon:yes stop_codon:yes gene_type:complete
LKDYSKIILTDADGVLLNWEYAFITWMEEHGHNLVQGYQFIYDVAKRFGIEKEKSKKLVRFFNESATIGYLPALRDAEHYVKLLGKLGYKFHVITSLSKNQNAQKLRTKNLKKLFGNVFEEFIYLDTGDDKDEVLKQYKNTGCYWIEDKPVNCEEGMANGLKGVLMEHGHNMDYKGNATLVKDWKEIYNLVTAK